MIPKEQYDLLSENVKEILRQQHAFYRDQIRALQKGSHRNSTSFFKGSPSPPRTMNLTNTMILPEDVYSDIEHEEQEIETPISTESNKEDPVLSTFHQFLHKAREIRQITVCSTTRVVDLPSRAINAHFVRDGDKYGRLVSDNAADTGSLSPRFCHIAHTSQ